MKNKLDLGKFRSSSIGTTVESSDSELKIEMTFSSVSWFFITFFGTTRIPQKITFTCLETKEDFEVLTDRKLIEYYLLFTKK